MKAKFLTLATIVLICAASARSQKPLVPQTVTSVDATSDVTVNATLDPGFLLKGTVTGAGASYAILTAISTTSNATYEAPVLYPSNTYRIALPADTYNLQVSFTIFPGFTTTNAVFISYKDSTLPSAFTLSADTVHDVTLPHVATTTVMGTFSNLDASLPTRGLMFESTSIPGFDDVWGSVILNASGNYTIQLPNGIYTALLSQSDPLYLENLYTRFGPLALANPLNFTVPTISTATLSGTVSIMGSSTIPTPASIYAMDTTGPPPPQITSSVSGSVPSNGAYSLTLGTGESYALSLGVDLPLLPPPAPAVPLSCSVSLPGILTSDTVFNPSFPAPPSGVTISGRVTLTGTTRPVRNASVSVSGHFSNGAANCSFWQRTTADSQGNYRFIVPAGTNYTVMFSGSLFTPADFNGDGKSDYPVFRPSNGTWYVEDADGSNILQVQFGENGDIPVPGRYRPDVVTDAAVWRPATGTWYTWRSGQSVQWGTAGDIPVPGDYDGDGLTDFAVWRPSDGNWYILPSSNPGFPIVQPWGTSGDIPVPGDYDGDGKADFAVWRPSTGQFFIIPSSNPGTPIVQRWGTSGDIPVPGDYDGDGKTDFAVFRPSTGIWYIIPSSNPGAQIVQQWGTNGDIPVPGDYDGDGITDIAVWRPSNGTWYVIPSSAPATPIVTQWGTSGDIPTQKPIGQP
jgi:hypothetical protein